MAIKRREVIGLLVATAAGSRLANAQAPAAAPQNAEEELQAARLRRQADAQRIAMVMLPQTTEPAFRFRA